MKLHPNPRLALNTVTAYGAGYVEVNGQRYETCVHFMPEGEVSAWPVARAADLTEADLGAFLERTPELILLGTGSRHLFLPPHLSAALVSRSIGIECMSSAAACRTYNILMSEGRLVAAALIVE